jgi:CheY-like chemotaxis protein
VLVVDDDPDSRRILQAVLEYGGAVVSVAATARDALGVLERLRADVILIDVAQPDEDGYGLVQHLRSWPAERGRIPVVAMTASRDGRDEILGAGYAEHVRKPVAIDGLYRVLGRVSGRRGRPR